MSLQLTPLDKITEVDLARLVADGTSESQTTEYKRDWTAADDDGKSAFLANVASLANTNGGDIIYGIEALSGVPKKLVGLKGFNPDAEKLRVESLLRDWTEPRVGGVGFQIVPLASGDPAFVVRVPRSWSGPHRVNFKGANRFYVRSTAGKYELNVAQLRSAFTGMERTLDRIRDFRLERVNRIANGDVGVRLSTNYRFALHVMPLAELETFIPHDAILLHQYGLIPMGAFRSKSSSVNFDGCMVSSTAPDGSTGSYVQLFRNGYLEAVRCSSGGQNGNMMSQNDETTIRDALKTYRRVFAKLGLRPPFAVAVSHLNVSGFMMYRPPTAADFEDAKTYDRQFLLIPERILETDDDDAVDGLLRLIFDQVWNAFGLLGSPSFDLNGKWVPGARS